MRYALAVLMLASIALAGCGENDPFDPDAPRRGAGTQFGGQLAPVDDQGQAIGGTRPPPPPPPPPDGTQPPPPPPPPTVREGAQVGVSGKGDYGGAGFVTTPISVYFRVPERLVFNVQIPKAMKEYRAIHEHFPKTQEEFMEKIIAENYIQLPKLPGPDERYVYDPEKAASQSQYDPNDPPLLVEHPPR